MGDEPRPLLTSTFQAQEIHLFHHLALLTNRVYVYQPFMWRHRKELQPLSGFLSGPTQDSLSSVIWDEVCPEDKVKNVTLEDPYEHRWSQAIEVLSGAEECVYVTNWILNWGYVCLAHLRSLAVVHAERTVSWNPPRFTKYGQNIRSISTIITNGPPISKT